MAHPFLKDRDKNKKGKNTIELLLFGTMSIKSGARYCFKKKEPLLMNDYQDIFDIFSKLWESAGSFD